MQSVKIFLIFCTAVFLTIACLSCSAGTPAESEQQNTQPYPSLGMMIPDEDNTVHPRLDIVLETDYSAIRAYTDQSEYPVDVDRILITIQNDHIGKGFYFWETPYLEKWTDGQWIRQDYRPPELFYESRVILCGEEGNRTEPQKTGLFFCPRYMVGPLTPGDYRFLIFTGGDKVVYVPVKFR